MNPRAWDEAFDRKFFSPKEIAESYRRVREMQKEIDRERVIEALECCIEVQKNPDGDGGTGCDICPYRPVDSGTCPRLDVMLSDALELLKAQRPRVLTLEEIQNWQEDTITWYEHHGVIGVRPRLVSYADSKCVLFTDGGKWFFEEDSYGTRWRCWSARPTDEQREGTPWET